jgi:hypothetical protein
VWWTQANRITNGNIRERKAFLFSCKRQVTFSEIKMTRKSGRHWRTNTRIYSQLSLWSSWMWYHIIVDRCNCFEGISRFHFQVFSSAKTETAGFTEIFIAVYKATWRWVPEGYSLPPIAAALRKSYLLNWISLHQNEDQGLNVINVIRVSKQTYKTVGGGGREGERGRE